MKEEQTAVEAAKALRRQNIRNGFLGLSILAISGSCYAYMTYQIRQNSSLGSDFDIPAYTALREEIEVEKIDNLKRIKEDLS